MIVHRTMQTHNKKTRTAKTSTVILWCYLLFLCVLSMYMLFLLTSTEWSGRSQTGWIAAGTIWRCRANMHWYWRHYWFVCTGWHNNTYEAKRLNQCTAHMFFCWYWYWIDLTSIIVILFYLKAMAKRASVIPGTLQRLGNLPQDWGLITTCTGSGTFEIALSCVADALGNFVPADCMKLFHVSWLLLLFLYVIFGVFFLGSRLSCIDFW